MSTFGEALAVALNGRHQSWLARELRIDPGSVSRWIRGVQIPTEENLARIEKVLKVDLSKAANAERQAKQSARFEIFMATPMASFGTDGEYAAQHGEMLDLVRVIESTIGSTYWAGATIAASSEFDAPGIGELENLRALRNARFCLFVHLSPHPLATSALIEVGLALGWKQPVAIFAPSSKAVPYMVRGLPTVSEQLSFLPSVRFHEAETVSDVQRLVRVNGVDLFATSRR